MRRKNSKYSKYSRRKSNRKVKKKKRVQKDDGVVYLTSLMAQVKQKRLKTHKLPAYFISTVQKYYKTPLKSIRYYYSVKTRNNAAVTFGNHIFFPSRPNHHWFLHELHHSDQYKRAGKGILPFLKAYRRQSMLHPKRKYIPYEMEAENKADKVYKSLNGKLCGKPFPCKDD